MGLLTELLCDTYITITIRSRSLNNYIDYQSVLKNLNGGREPAGFITFEYLPRHLFLFVSFLYHLSTEVQFFFF